MDAMEFVNKVREMRAVQQRRYRDEAYGLMHELEAEVDAALAEGVTVFETKSLAGEVEQMALGFGELDASDIGDVDE